MSTVSRLGLRIAVCFALTVTFGQTEADAQIDVAGLDLFGVSGFADRPLPAPSDDEADAVSRGDFARNLTLSPAAFAELRAAVLSVAETGREIDSVVVFPTLPVPPDSTVQTGLLPRYEVSERTLTFYVSPGDVDQQTRQAVPVAGADEGKERPGPRDALEVAVAGVSSFDDDLEERPGGVALTAAFRLAAGSGGRVPVRLGAKWVGFDSEGFSVSDFANTFQGTVSVGLDWWLNPNGVGPTLQGTAAVRTREGDDVRLKPGITASSKLLGSSKLAVAFGVAYVFERTFGADGMDSVQSDAPSFSASARYSWRPVGLGLSIRGANRVEGDMELAGTLSVPLQLARVQALSLTVTDERAVVLSLSGGLEF